MARKRGTLAVSLASGSLVPVIAMLHSWANRRKKRCTVRLQGPGGGEVEITDVTLEEARRLMTDWIGGAPA